MNYYIDDKVCCILHKASDWKEGLDFVTDENQFVQAGTWWYQSGKALDRHHHNRVPRQSDLTQETVIIMQGRLEVELYDFDNNFTEGFEMEAGDFAVFLCGGHGYNILDNDTKIIEVKNGPFVGVELDKTRF